MHNTRNNTPPDPMMLTMNAIGVDAMAVGNHEYGRPHHAPYLVKELQGVRVGILGLTT